MKIGFAVAGCFFFLLFAVLFVVASATEGHCLSIVLGNICSQSGEIFASQILNKITALGVFISALGTVALILTVYYSRQATLAAIEASHAAKLAVEHAREASIRELRPYLTQALIQNTLLKSNNEAVCRNLKITWKNEGKTPAVDVWGDTNHLVTDKRLAEDFLFPSRFEQGQPVGAVGPGKTFYAETSNISPEDILAVMRQEKILHAWSWVEYSGFQSGVRYRSEYHITVEYYGADDPLSPDLTITVKIQPSFNGVEGNCFRPPSKSSSFEP